uniref:Molybdopterin biosynthesis protein n=1 Tax=Pterosiphonia complanata TaxID=884089 RepID=UPI0022FD5510|nr:Molybdopterin biosynthesis protein [Pterosiphonia complanata]WAX03174.1 Molybdopterin biosynthesis protein [Pterosiphonia complanata]
MLNIKSDITIKISQEEYKNYSKQLILENIGIQGQKKLKNAKVLIIGAGGLGCPIIIYLATSGIGCIGLIDGDKIESSNLNRQILYNIDDIKNFKVNSAKQKIQVINHNCKIIKHRYYLNNENSIEIISYYDIVIDTTDNFKTRYTIDTTCYQLHKTYIYGAIDKFEGQVVSFNYKNGIRYTNLYEKNILLSNTNCNRNGVMGITCGYTGILQAIETIKIILGLEKRCKNFLLIYNTLKIKNEKRKIYLKRHKNNKTNIFKFKNILLKNEIKIINNKFIIIDLRTKIDFNIKHIKKSINIPINKFKSNKTIKLIKYYITNNNLILYCNTLERSIIASYILKNNNILHYILHPNK